MAITTHASIDDLRMALCGEAVVFVRALDAGNPDPGELGLGIERLRSAAANYLGALQVEEEGGSR